MTSKKDKNFNFKDVFIGLFLLFIISLILWRLYTGLFTITIAASIVILFLVISFKISKKYPENEGNIQLGGLVLGIFTVYLLFTPVLMPLQRTWDQIIGGYEASAYEKTPQEERHDELVDNCIRAKISEHEDEYNIAKECLKY
jgi:hypothetical protein